MHQNQEVHALQQALALKLRSALSDAGCPTLDDVRRTLVARGISMNQSTVTRYFNGELPTENKAKSREEMLKLASLTRLPTGIMSDWEALVNAARASRNTNQRNRRQSCVLASSTWFQIIPIQPGRDYLSIDIVELQDREPQSEYKPNYQLLTGFCRRVYPQEDIDRSWLFEGFTDTSIITLTFNPYQPSNTSSRGSIHLTKTPGEYPQVYYPGKYCVQLDGPAGFTVRDIEWYSDIPTRYLPDVALLDLDNTLRSGWSIVSWAISETMKNLTHSTNFRDRVLDLRELYEVGAISHDEFATQAAESYAELLKSNDIAEVQRAGKRYVDQELRRALLPFAKPLVLSLRDRHIAPILVTGAPKELAIEVARVLNIEEVYPLSVNAGVIVNPGTAEGKQKAVDKITEGARRVLLAAGDSASDIPLMHFAQYRIVSPQLRSLLDFDQGVQYYEFSSSTDAGHILRWIESNLRISPFDEDH